VAKILEVFFIFLRLGLTSFGGPIAHLSYFHGEFVLRRKWFDESHYADLVALCQFLPGPASSQVGIAIGLSRAGVLGAIAAWTGFTLPSALLLIAFAFGIASFGDDISRGWLHGLKVVAVAIVAQALWGMGAKLCPERKRATIAVLAALAAIIFPFALGQVGIIIAGGLAGWAFLKEATSLPREPIRTPLPRRVGAAILVGFFALLVVLPISASHSGSQGLKLFDSFFRAGSLVFGGGHVVLPLLKAEVVNPGWVSSDAFMAGYGAAQAIPGPLFTFSAYLGAVSRIPPAGLLGAFICLIAAFLPSFLLILGVLPFWERLRRVETMRFAMQGINAAVVGLLLSAFYNPVWTSAILSPKDFGVAAVCFLLLVFWKAPSLSVVIFSAVTGGLWL
jgi:chromate transporter